MHKIMSPSFEEKTYLSMATLPADNPASIDELVRYPRYAITLIEHDYHGKTPALWNAAYRDFKMDAVMAMMVGDPNDAPRILEVFKNDPRYIGGGAGVGFKDENVKHLDELDPLAQAIGASNLIQKLPSGKLKGWNTDARGYVASLEDLLKAKGKTVLGTNVVLLGAGGTGNAIAFALAERGAHICIINRTLEKARKLAQQINKKMGWEVAYTYGEDAPPSRVFADADVIINTSTKGAVGDFEAYSALAPAKLPATPENIQENVDASLRVFDLLPPTAIVSDVILRNEPTPLLRQAREQGFTTLDGVPMVVNQGVEAFMILHGDEIAMKEKMKKEEVRARLFEVMERAVSSK